MMLRMAFAFIFLASLCLSGCAGNGTEQPGVFLPPSQVSEGQTAIPVLPTQVVPFGTQAESASTCEDSLIWLEDLTVPDGSLVQPGAPVDKQWRVQNAGACNWDNRYRLRWIGYELLGVRPERSLYPARAGTTAVIQIIFTAPQETGFYSSMWQAVDPVGQLFGDPIYIEIVVQDH
ncbi:MAG: hypothetical protein FJZ96_10505 [Chloroflexi bacterium]|nr:hypothetical protein [Chloroflexota bacterium]